MHVRGLKTCANAGQSMRTQTRTSSGRGLFLASIFLTHLSSLPLPAARLSRQQRRNGSVSQLAERLAGINAPYGRDAQRGGSLDDDVCSRRAQGGSAAPDISAGTLFLGAAHVESSRKFDAPLR
jgi:hypothetical protein